METATQINISAVLKELGIQAKNHGVSTGSNHFGSGGTISSYSPTNGELIAEISTATQDDYNQVTTDRKSVV